jgi:hypothetical protein
MKRRLVAGGVLAILVSLIPASVWAAGDKASELVMVADTRTLHGIGLYLATVYNQNLWLFAVWSVVITTALGAGLGVIMDLLMSRVGIDLTKGAGHAEH